MNLITKKLKPADLEPEITYYKRLKNDEIKTRKIVYIMGGDVVYDRDNGKGYCCWVTTLCQWADGIVGEEE